MGDDFLRRQARGFTTRHAAHRMRLAMPTLLTAMRTDRSITEYSCRASAGRVAPAVGAEVYLRVGAAGVDIIHGNAVAGAIATSDLSEVHRKLANSGLLVPARVVSRAGVGGIFAVSIESANDGDSKGGEGR